MLEALLYVCVCVCPLITAVSCARADKPIEVLFGVWTGVGQRNHVGARIPPGKGKFFGGGISQPVVNYMETSFSLTENIFVPVCLRTPED